ncbi:AI-2 transport protein TqsA [Cohaesibacter sp. ES.047]|uniref:AI-2E family transporter n=1 Tax=Cohaesibacter sp. ES.047 TaxID=1798205 RepID=UPI000BB70748|nr:AI-2E family transporter [Cohaesibacter sp. ES.047]SNY92292.1 AI-2 transport protein TqsA [Cohaesibacter sp. ES.047]
MSDKGLSPADGHSAWHKANPWLITIIVIILSGWALRAMTTVVVPVILAFFLTLMVRPLDRMTAAHLPTRIAWLGHVVALATVLCGVGLFVTCLWIAAGQIADQFSGAEKMPLMSWLDLDMRADATAAPDRQGTNTESSILLRETYTSAVKSLGDAASQWISGFANSVINKTGRTLGGVIFVIFLTLLMLVEAPHWSEKLDAVASRRTNRDMQNTLRVISERLMRYLVTRTVMGLLTAALYALWLWLFGVDLLLVWGFLAFLLNFVPTIGSLVAGVLPVIYAFVQKDPSSALIIGGGVLVIEQVIGNFIDPRVQGQQVSVSPLVVLIVLALWGWLWGIIGTVLAVPITITVIIAFSHFDTLRPIALFLSNETSMEDLDRIANTKRF